MSLSRKAQGMPMNVIVIAALVLIVMIILAVVLAGKFRIFATTTRSCTAQGGYCCEEDCKTSKRGPLGVIAGKVEYSFSCPENEAKLSGTDCEDKTKYPNGAICCIQLTEKSS